MILNVLFEACVLNLFHNIVPNVIYFDYHDDGFPTHITLNKLGVDNVKADIVVNLIHLASVDTETKKDLIDKLYRSDANMENLISYLVSKIPDFYK